MTAPSLTVAILRQPQSARAPRQRLPRTGARAPLKRTLWRYRGGTYSSTVERLRFADGSIAHTDLIRLVPDVAAYSLDFHGTYPQGTATYREATWPCRAQPQLDGVKAELEWILVNSYPALPLKQLTARLRTAGYWPGHGTIKAHEAIGAAQAALWHFTNGLDLDVQALDAPVRLVITHADERLTSRIDPTAVSWSGLLRAGDTVAAEFELAEPLPLGFFEVTLGATTTDGVMVRLERSSDGRSWSPVPSADIRHSASDAALTHTRNLGLGALVSQVSRGAYIGYRHYRLVFCAPPESAGRIELLDARWGLAAGSRFRNPTAVVALYRYLLDGARAHAATRSGPLLRAPTLTRAGRDGTWVGPVRWLGTTPAAVRILGSAPAELVDDTGCRVEVLVPGREYKLHIGPVLSVGELQIQVTHQGDEPVLLRGLASTGDSTSMAPLAVADVSARPCRLIHHLILTVHDRRSVMAAHPAGRLHPVP